MTVHNTQRKVTAPGTPTSKRAAIYMEDELRGQMKRAANTVLVLGIILIIAGALLVALVSSMGKRVPDGARAGAWITLFLGLIYLGLYVWALKNPLAATIVALVLYGTLKVLDVVFWLGADRDQRGPLINPCACVFAGFILVSLIQGVYAGVKYKQMQKSGHFDVD